MASGGRRRQASGPRRRGELSVRPPVGEPADPREFDWPAFVDSGDAEILVGAVEAAAIDDHERADFLGILHRAYEDTLELESLYADLPGVLASHELAIESFRTTLDSAVALTDGWPRLAAIGPGRTALKPFPDWEGGTFPCKPQIMVKPWIVFGIVGGVELVSGGDGELREAYVGALQALWQRTTILDDLLARAVDDDPGRPGGLGNAMRVLVRETRGPAVVEGLARGGDLRGGAPMFPESREPPILALPGFGGGGTPWPPPEGNPPAVWPPPKGGRPGFDICEMLGTLCKQLVFGGIRGWRHVPTSTYVDGLTSISPTSACAGDHVTLSGTFPATQPADVVVVIGSTVAKVVSWSTTSIVIEVPANAPSGCVAFMDASAESERFSAMQANEQAAASLAEGLACMGNAVAWPKTPAIGPSLAPCTGFNYLKAGPPVIDSFRVNGGTQLGVVPGTQLILTWSVRNVSTVMLERISTAGPPLGPTTKPASGTLGIGQFTGMQPTSATYRLTASNGCGSVTATVSVNLRQPPTLGVLRIEIVQVIQTPTNSVRLVAGKRAIARVFVNSGIANGFNNGAGANVQPSVTGRMTITPAGGGAAVSCGPPINAAGSINAALGGGPRGTLGSSLNFELPLGELNGSRRLDVIVFVSGHENDPEPGWKATGSVTVNFVTVGGQEILPWLIADRTVPGSLPNVGQFGTSLGGALARQPIAQTGFTVNPAIFDMTTPTEPLTATLGWQLLVNRLATTIFVFPSTPVGGNRTGIVPVTPGSPLNGIALPRVALTVPTQVSQATFRATCAHEMSHTAGSGHAPCGGAAPPIQPGLPATTEDVGLDVATRTIFPAGSFELMGACSITGGAGEDRWPSIALYDGFMFGRFPV
jgi:hypothetical protein